MISIFDSTFFLVYFSVLAFFLGAVLGSFLNCAAYRIVHHEKVSKGRSHCPTCGHTLGVFDLFPIFSWVFLKGRCRYCKTRIPVRYPLTELFFGCVTVSLLLKFDLTWLFLRNYILVCCLFPLSLTDLEDMLIPDRFHIICAAAWVAFLPLLWSGVRDMLMHLLASAVFGGGMLLLSLLMDRILKKDSLGGGDVKLFFVMGLYLGLLPGLLALLLSCILGLLPAALKRIQKPDEDRHFPFGPCIALAMTLVLLLGDPVIAWYLELIS